jgi:hypothetical protein
MRRLLTLAALLRRVTSSPQSTSFGYIAAEADLKRLGAR